MVVVVVDTNTLSLRSLRIIGREIFKNYIASIASNFSFEINTN